MGSTMCKGGSLQCVFQLNQNQLPKPQGLELITRLYNVTTIMRDTKIYNNYKINNYTKYTQDTMISHPRAKHAPSGFHSTWTAFTDY